jgi:hypothetical protein
MELFLPPVRLALPSSILPNRLDLPVPIAVAAAATAAPEPLPVRLARLDPLTVLCFGVGNMLVLRLFIALAGREDRRAEGDSSNSGSVSKR